MMQRSEEPKHREDVMFKHYLDSYCPYPTDLEFHTRVSDSRAMGHENKGPRQASNFRADAVVRMPESHVAIEAKQFDFRSPWIENGNLHDGIGQTILYGRYYDLTELWHFVRIPHDGPSSSAERAERVCQRVYDYFRSWFPDGLPFGYRIIGVRHQEETVNHEFDIGSSAVELGYHPEAEGRELNYPFRTGYEEQPVSADD